MIGNLLRYGVIVSAVVILIGTGQLLSVYGSSSSSQYLLYNPGSIPHGAFPVSASALLKGLAAFDAYSLIELGVAILIATPVSRVAISVLLFGAEKDTSYVLITAVVLALLLFSLLVTPFIPGSYA
jgi:uncharacterized membrane protein